MKRLLLLLLFNATIGHAQNFWTETTPFPNNPEYYGKSISIVDENVVWVCGTDHIDEATPYDRFSISLDGGITWTEGVVNLGSTFLHVSNIHAISATTAYVSVQSNLGIALGGIYVTCDAGVTWTKQHSALYNTGVESMIDFIHMFDANNGVAVGEVASGYFEIYTTSNSGANWIRVPSTNIQPNLDGEKLYGALHYDAVGNAVWFGTNNGNIHFSSDRGHTWGKTFTPTSDFGGIDYAHFAFKSPNEGIFVANSGTWQIDVNGWDWNFEETFPTGSYRNLNVVRVPQASNTYFSWGPDQANLPGSSYSIDGGLSWINIDEDMSPTITAKFYSGNIGYCTGYYLSNPSQLKFFRLTDALNRLLKNNTFTAEKRFSAVPNPTKDFVKLSGAKIHSVTIYDVSGKLILSENYNGLDEISLNLSSLQTGAYFAKVNSEDMTSTIKILKN